MISRRLLIAGAASLPLLPARAALPGTLTRLNDLAAPGLLPRRVDVWRPAGANGPLPLLIMHDGQNLFDPALAYGGKTWGVAETISQLVAAGRLPPVMVAGVWNTPQRWQDYVPAGIIDRLPADVHGKVMASMPGGSLSPAYAHALADVLVPRLRAEFAVAPGRVAVMGSSMGGLASLNLLVERPDVFGLAGCLSTHWPTIGLDPVAQPAVQAAIAGWLGERLGPPRTRKLWFDHGDRTLDQHYAPYQAAVDAQLPGLGWQPGRDFVSRSYPGAAHEEASWAARLADPLTFLFKAFA
jgi:enterochelin esterase-like enzyme